MTITAAQVAALREKTGISMMQCKKALEENGGDEAKAIDALRKKGAMKAEARADRETKEGTIGVYTHANNKMAAMVKLGCETDFVARNEEFVEFARNLAMHVVAMNPKVVDPSEVDEAFIAKEKEIAIEQLKNEGKPQDMVEKIWAGKESKLRNEVALLEQELVMIPGVKVKDALTDLQTKMGENIKIVSFKRFEI